jgi:hypothetical protein
VDARSGACFGFLSDWPGGGGSDWEFRAEEDAECGGRTSKVGLIVGNAPDVRARSVGR